MNQSKAESSPMSTDLMMTPSAEHQPLTLPALSPNTGLKPLRKDILWEPEAEKRANLTEVGKRC